MEMAENLTENFLSEEATQDVFEAMYEAREKWRNIGGVFRLLDATLDAIRAEENGQRRRSGRSGKRCTTFYDGVDPKQNPRSGAVELELSTFLHEL